MPTSAFVPRSVPHRRRFAVTCWLAAALAARPAGAETARDFADLSLEELLAESVTSVGRKQMRLHDTPSAITVLHGDDLYRTSARSIAEALRLVPGMEIRQINAAEYAVSSRGFNNQYANKLLVLIDGRSVYTPTIAGVHWGEQQMLIDDLDRIEVIRGPGATSWGANAVNGVINVTSKSARETQGTLVSATYGTNLRPAFGARVGVQVGPNLYARVQALSIDHEPLPTDHPAGGNPLRDRRGSARLDWFPTAADQVTVQAEYSVTRVHQHFELPSLLPVPRMVEYSVNNRNRGAYLLGRWTRNFSDSSQASLQAYVDDVRHFDAMSEEDRRTYDVDWQHRFTVAGRHDIVWGAGFRRSPIKAANTSALRWTPGETAEQLASGFVQDEIAVVPKRLNVTAGVKLEDHTSTGLEVQPSLRAMWTPGPRHAVWTSISRAVRTPNLIERFGRYDVGAAQVPASPPVLTALIPDPNIRSETLVAYEAGVRAELGGGLLADLATFYNVYRHLHRYGATPPRLELTPSPPHLLLPIAVDDRSFGDTYGAELSLQWRPVPGWRLAGTYTLLRMRLTPRGAAGSEGIEHQGRVSASWEATRQLELHSHAYITGAFDQTNQRGMIHFPGHTRLDFGLTWKPSATVELSAWGANLLSRDHVEFPTYHQVIPSAVRRSFHVTTTLRF